MLLFKESSSLYQGKIFEQIQRSLRSDAFLKVKEVDSLESQPLLGNG